MTKNKIAGMTKDIIPRYLIAKLNEKDGKDENTKPLDYDVYLMSVKEKLGYILIAAVIFFVVGFIFYHHIILSLLLTPFALFYPNMRRKEIIDRRRNELNIQFKDMLYSLSSSLGAGKSIERAFTDVLSDLDILYPDPDSYIIRETEVILRRLEMNETIESALEDFAKRTKLEDIENFIDVFTTCKRMGGNIVEVIKNTSTIITDKIEIKSEIETLLSARKFEQKVLNVMPIGLVLLLTWSAGDYLEPIFTMIQGRIAMTVAIGLLVLSYFVSKKIMGIRI